MNRPLVIVALAFTAGVLVAAQGFCPGFILPLLAFAVGVCLILSSLNPAYSRPASVALCFGAAGALLWNAHHAGPPGDPLSWTIVNVDTTNWAIEGQVREVDLTLPGERYVRFILKVDRVHIDETEFPLEGRVLVRWSDPDMVLYRGDRVRVRGRLSLSIASVNPRIQSEEDYFRRHGVHTAARASGPRAVERLASGRWWSPFHFISRLRQAQADRLARITPESVLPFVLAVWLGDRGGVTREEYQSYVDTGTAHILAVSGIHAGLVFMTVSFVLEIFLRNRRLRALLIMGAVLLFALLAGARVTALRAAVMIVVYLIADLFERQRDAPTALSISALLFLMTKPDLLFDIGFQLSFLSVASILLFTDRLTALLTWVPRWFREPIAITLGVQILPLPLAIRYFHVLPLAAPAANLVVVPLLAVSLWLCFLTSVTVWVWSDAALLFAHALLPVVSLIRWIAENISRPWFTHVTLAVPTALASVAYWGAVASVAALFQTRLQRKPLAAAGAVVLAGVTLLVWTPLQQPSEVVFLDVGRGDAAFLRTPGGTTVLVDAGDRNPFTDTGSRTVAPFLWASGVRRIDYAVVTHPDRDHIGGMFYVLERMGVGEVVLSGVVTDRPLERELIALCRRRGVPVRRLFRGDALPVKGATIEVLHPPPGWPAGHGINNASLVLRVTWDALSVLLPGDIEFKAEAELAGTDCRAAVLKVPHHGSGTSSSETFIRAASPQYAIVSTGGLPGPEAVDEQILRRYREHGVALYRTDWVGGIRLTLEDGRLALLGARPQRGYLYHGMSRPAALSR